MTSRSSIKTTLLAALFAPAACIPFAPLASAAAPPVPASPVAAANFDTYAGLSWTASSGATSYIVYRGASRGGESLVASGTSVPGNTYEDTGLNRGQTYYYKVAAVNASGTSAQSAEFSVLTLPPWSGSFTATGGDSQIFLNWGASATATGYKIYRDTLGGYRSTAGPSDPYGTTTFLTGNNATTYTDTGLINGQTYYYEISPVNTSGTNEVIGSSASATATGTSGEAPAGPPANLTATSGNGQVLLSWSPVSNATTYNVYRGASSGSETLLQSGVTVIKFTDTGLANGSFYYYKVCAVDGSQISAFSGEASATPHVPAAPAGLTATAGSTQVVLNWTPGGAGCAIYRGVLSGSETLLNSGLTGSTYTDAGLTNGATYYYKVQALNAGGAGPLCAEVSATPTGLAAAPWTGTVSFNLPGEPVQTVNAYIPDVNRPIQGALILADNFPNLLAVAAKYNLIQIGVCGYTPPNFNFGTIASPIYPSTAIHMMDWRWTRLGGLRVLAALNAASQMFPAHPEIQNTAVVLYGFSVSTDAINPGIAQTPLITRTLAMINESEIDEDRWNPTMPTIPHILLASGFGDPYSNLLSVLQDWPVLTHDNYVRALATNEGAPLTVIDNVGQWHGGNGDNPFVSVWLDDVLSQRLPATLPVSSPVSLPSWQNTSAWAGTYDMALNVSLPWGDGVSTTGIQLINNVVSAETSYADPRPFTWLPSQNTANAWLNYAVTGNFIAYPIITSTTAAAGLLGSPFTYAISATNSPLSYGATGLPPGLTINTSTGIISGTLMATGTSTVLLDAVNASGTGTKTLVLSVSDINTPAQVEYNDTAGEFTYAGTSWGYSANRNVGDYDNDIHYTSNNGDSATLTFTGVGVSLIAETDSDEGDINVQIDGGTATEVSLYSASRESQQAVYSASGLTYGTHTLMVTKVSGTYMVVDAAIVSLPGYSQWADLSFTSQQLANPSISGDAATPWNDGVSNLLKYLCDINPAVPMDADGRAALPTVGMTAFSGSTYLTLTYRQNQTEAGLTINVQTSPDLQTWQTVAPNHIQIVGTDPATGDPLIQYQVPVSPSGASKEFIRLNVTGP